MNILVILIIISIVIASGFVVAFIWAIKNGQFDDAYTPSVRILWDDESKIIKNPSKKVINKPKS